MTKKKSVMTVKTDLSVIFTDGQAKAGNKSIPAKKGVISINESLGVVLKQMKATGIVH
ncbi:hypothetical protein ACIQYS_01015 [Psychrobacillus sp. NPDC096426]|uniref:hypothetical protein n=1 Tax=Psychrobacillus sp. NPDC096426 TaxID=3364491 RepID=UPI0038294A93